MFSVSLLVDTGNQNALVCVAFAQSQGKWLKIRLVQLALGAIILSIECNFDLKIVCVRIIKDVRVTKRNE